MGLNKQGIGELKAGRELDALVAEKVMGWTHREQGGTGKYEHTMVFDTGEKQHGVAKTIIDWHFRPSERIEDAWEVVEKCGLSVVHSEDGWYAVKASDIEHIRMVNGRECIGIICEGSPALSETPALAICLAALKSVEEPVS